MPGLPCFDPVCRVQQQKLLQCQMPGGLEVFLHPVRILRLFRMPRYVSAVDVAV